MTAGYLAFSFSWHANRVAATPVSGELPQIMGSVPASSRASVLAGLTNDSLSGRQRWETRSRSAAAASSPAAGMSATPSRSAMIISGTARPHSVKRGMPAGSTGMNGARACSAIWASGEPGPAHGEQRAAPAHRFLRGRQGLLGLPEQDTATTRSAAPTQPGSR